MARFIALALAVLLTGCASTSGRQEIPEGMSKSDYMMCQYFGALYGLIATGRQEHQLSEVAMMEYMDKGIDNADVGPRMAEQLKAWAPAAVYRVYQSPGKITPEEWERHVESECLGRVESDALKRVLQTAIEKKNRRE